MINLSDSTKAELAEKLSQAIQIREKMYVEVAQKQQETYTIDNEVHALQMLLGIKTEPNVLGLRGINTCEPETDINYRNNTASAGLKRKY